MSGKSLRMSDRSPGPILQAQPALWTVSVKRKGFFSSTMFPQFEINVAPLF